VIWAGVSMPSSRWRSMGSAADPRDADGSSDRLAFATRRTWALIGVSTLGA
jgi:hypothetical protein